MLTSQQKKAIALLANGATQERVASSVGVSARTIIRWKKLPEFQEALLDASQNQQEIVVEEVRKMTSETTIQELYPAAIVELGRILNSSEREANKLKAIQILFSKLPEIKPNQEADSFPIKGDWGEEAEEIKNLSDEELQRLYLKTLAES